MTGHRRHRARAWIVAGGRKVVPWVLGALAVAVISQLTAKYYADRQEQLEIKATVIKTLTRASAEGYDAAVDFVDYELDSDQSWLATVREHNRLMTQWSLAQAEVDATMFLHFDGSDAERHWDVFRNAFFYYCALARSESVDLRVKRMTAIRSYLAQHPLPRESGYGRLDWKLLSCDPACDKIAWRGEYRSLGLELLRRRGALARDILVADARNLG